MLHVPAITISGSSCCSPCTRVTWSPADCGLVSWLITTGTAGTGHRGQAHTHEESWAKNIQTQLTVIVRESEYIFSVDLHPFRIRYSNLDHLDFSIPQHPQGSTPFACSLRCEMFLTDIFQIYCLHSEFSFLRINLDCSPRTQKLKYISF